MTRLTPILDALKWDAALVALLAVLVWGYQAMQSPALQRAQEESAPGSRPPDRSEGDILLLLPDSPAAEAADFSELDCSYGWYNSLWREYGSFATSLARNLSPEILVGRSVVILPRRVAEDMPVAGVIALQRFAQDGGQVVLELPGQEWVRLSGVTPSDKPRPAMQISSIEGMDARGPMREHLADVPLAGKLLPVASAQAWPAGPVLLEVDSAPGLVVRREGKGQIFSFLFDYGCTITALQQGKPTRAMEFGAPGASGLLPTSQRVGHERLLTTHVPYADLLTRAVFERVGLERPLPRLWKFPGTAAGALLVTHPSPEMTRATLGYADWARQSGGVSTLLVAPDRFDATQAALAHQTGAAVGLLWVRGEQREPITKGVGVGAFEPLARELSLVEQRLMLDYALGTATATRVARSEGSLWHNDWATSFRHLAAGEIRVDNSFGPQSGQQFGYLFGTGLPFYPIDGRGLPLPVLELPYVLDGAGITPTRLKRMLGNSASYFHQSLSVSLASDAMRRDPAPGILLTFREIFDMGREHRHWITTVHDAVDFFAARRQSVLTSQWSPGERRLSVSVNLIGVRLPTRPEGAVAGLALPRHAGSDEMSRVLVDGQEVPLKRLVPTGSGSERLLELGPGRHVVSVYYGAAP